MESVLSTTQEPPEGIWPDGGHLPAEQQVCAHGRTSFEPCEGCYADERGGDDPLTVIDARGMGYTDAEIDILRASGLLREDEDSRPWEPSTLEDVSWLVLQHKLLAAEEDALKQQLERRLKRIETRRRWLSRYTEECHRITLLHLEINPRTGKPIRKSIDLEDGRVGVRSVAGGPRIVDEAHLLAYLQVTDPLGETPLAAAVRARMTVEESGGGALLALRAYPELWTAKILAAPVKAFVNALAPIPDPDTGEARPATIPGVEIVEATERWYWE